MQLHNYYYYYVQCNNRREINNFLLTKMQQYVEESDDSDFSSDDDDIVLFAVHELHEMSGLALGPRINLQDISDMECDQLFRFGFIMLLTIMVPHRFHKIRFSKNDIQRLYMALGIPEKYKCVQGTTTTGMEGLLILLRRLTYPNRLCDLVKIFGRSQSEISLIFNTVS